MTLRKRLFWLLLLILLLVLPAVAMLGQRLLLAERDNEDHQDLHRLARCSSTAWSATPATSSAGWKGSPCAWLWTTVPPPPCRARRMPCCCWPRRHLPRCCSRVWTKRPWPGC